MCQNATLIVLKMATVTMGMFLVLSAAIGCTPEIVLSKPVGGCSEKTLKSIDDALVLLANRCPAKEEVK